MNAATDLLNSTLQTGNDTNLMHSFQSLVQQLFASALASISAFLALVVLVALRVFRARVGNALQSLRTSILRTRPRTSDTASVQPAAQLHTSSSRETSVSTQQTAELVSPSAVVLEPHSTSVPSPIRIPGSIVRSDGAVLQDLVSALQQLQSGRSRHDAAIDSHPRSRSHTPPPKKEKVARRRRASIADDEELPSESRRTKTPTPTRTNKARSVAAARA